MDVQYDGASTTEWSSSAQDYTIPIAGIYHFTYLGRFPSPTSYGGTTFSIQRYRGSTWTELAGGTRAWMDTASSPTTRFSVTLSNTASCDVADIIQTKAGAGFTYLRQQISGYFIGPSSSVVGTGTTNSGCTPSAGQTLLFNCGTLTTNWGSGVTSVGYTAPQ